ncbi:MAG: CRISPR-associated protein Cas4 [Thermodesulfobacteriota bacterium]|nr:CRISPR-associated protein Cas4 [Thermodesulfobacteriota bacterium]
MYTEDDLIPLSALQHILFCERQCALIHVEQMWNENLFTAEGRIMHERVDQAGRESRKDVRIEFAMPLRSLRLGLVGKADVVEFHRKLDSQNAKSHEWVPFPVEYKRGKPKKDNCDRVQLCAQALCLEEMLDVEIPRGALFYGKTRRRKDVDFDNALRQETESAAIQLHKLIESRQTPPPVYTPKCKSCSFFHVCLPKTIEKKHSVKQYLSGAISES